MKHRIFFISLLVLAAIFFLAKTDSALKEEEQGNGFAKYKLIPTLDPLTVSGRGLECNGTNTDFITLKASNIYVGRNLQIPRYFNKQGKDPNSNGENTVVIGYFLL